MADDIEAFLRRAAQRRKEQAGRKVPPPPKPRPEYTDSRSERQVRQVHPEEVVLEAEIADEQEGMGPLWNRPGQADHLQGDHLGSAAGLADVQREAHRKKTFHQPAAQAAVSSGFDPGEAMAEGDIAKTLISMLQSPQGLQQALLLREIIDRPEHRWE